MPRHRTPFSYFVPWILLVVLAGGAVFASFTLWKMQAENEGFALCKVGPGFDCSPALRSRYGKVFGIPLSSYAVGFYLFTFALAIQPLFRRRAADRNALVLAAMTAPGTLFCGWLVWVSLYRLRAYCPFCLALHILTPAILAGSLWALARRRSSLREIVRAEWYSILADRRVAAGLALVIVAVIIGIPVRSVHERRLFLEANPHFRDVLEGRFPRAEELERHLAGRPFRGKEDAMVTIVAFADFTCPICLQAKDSIEDLMDVYDVKFVYINHPRSSECNPAAPAVHAGSCLGALVAQYTRLHHPERFWTVHDAIYGTPGLLEEKRADRLAEIAGAPDMTAIVMDSEAHRALRSDLQLATMVGVSQVPSVFINGMGVQGFPEEWFLIEAVENEQDRIRARSAAGR